MTNVQSETKSSRSMTLSSVLLAQRFSSTLLGSVNKLNPLHPNPSANSTETKKQHNPRRHVFATNTTHSNAQENQNPLPSTTSAVGEKVKENRLTTTTSTRVLLFVCFSFSERIQVKNLLR